MADKLVALQYELLKNNVNYVISNSESDYKTISALGMEKVEFYSDATKKGVMQNFEKSMAPGTSVVIFDSALNEIVYRVGSEELGELITAEHINKMTIDENLYHEHDFELSSGENISTLMALGIYANWNWVIISFVDKDQLLRYSNEAMLISFFLASILLIFISVFVYNLSNRVSRSIVALEKGAHQLSNNELNVHIDIPGNDEFTSLANSFNQMSTEIKNTQTKLHQSICDEKKTNLSLIDSRKQYHDLIEDMSDIITRVDVAGYFLFVNKAASIMFGLPIEDCVGKLAFDFVHTDDRLRTKQNFALWLENKNSVFLHENRQVNMHGQVFNVSWSIHGEYDEFGHLIGFASTGRDITESKRHLTEKAELESQLFQAQKMEAVGQLAGGIAHDFNNMLGVIMGHAELALLQSEGSKSLTSNINSIIVAGQRSADLTKQLLTYARKQTTNPQVINLNESISSILPMLRHLIHESVELSFEQGINLELVNIDPSQMDQALVNFCVNASDAIEASGSITIKTENYSSNGEINNNDLSPDALFLPRGNYVKLSVSDNGSGIDKEVIKHIFEPFYTTKKAGKGTGLGLSTVFAAIKQNKGYIEVISELNHGARFNIYFHSIQNIEENNNKTAII